MKADILNQSKMKYLKVVFLFLFVVSCISVFGQNDTLLQKEVKVTKVYQPIIKDAEKILFSPNIQDDAKTKPDFNYSIQSRLENLKITPTAITAANLSEDTTVKSDVGYLKAGLGNYLTTYAELFLNQPQSEKSSFSLYLKHYSSGGDIRLYNGLDESAPFSQNRLGFSSKYLFQTSSLFFDAGYDRTRLNYYGMPNIENLTYSELDRKQIYQNAWMNAVWKNVLTDTESWSYLFNINYNFFKTRTGQIEHYLLFSNDLEHPIRWFQMKLHSGVEYQSADSLFVYPGILGKKQSFLVHIDPSFIFEGDEGKATVGVKMISRFDHDQNARVYLLPSMRIDWNAIEKYLNVYGGLEGNYNPNTLASLPQYCPFRNNLSIISPTIEYYNLFGGFKGRIVRNLNYNAGISYASIHGASSSFLVMFPGVVNMEQWTIDNRFMEEWINTKKTKFMGELDYSENDLSLKFSSNIYSYSIRPMGCPDYNLQLMANYKFSESLIFDASFYTQGKSFFQVVKGLNGIVLTTSSVPANQVDIYETKPIIDLEVGGRYQFTPKISFWAHGSNLFCHKQDPWLGYCEQGLHLLLGASYSF